MEEPKEEKGFDKPRKVSTKTICSNCINCFDFKDIVMIKKDGYLTYSCESCAKKNKNEIVKTPKYK